MKEYSMTSHNRRKHQRWLNHFCRRVNRTIERDPLWMGRFVVRQLGTQMEWFEDGSGGLLYCHLLFVDKKTKKVKHWHTDCLDISFHMWLEMNDFIVKDCAVWENEHPYKEKKDYRNISAL